jgi:hypothetical protein
MNSRHRPIDARPRINIASSQIPIGVSIDALSFCQLGEVTKQRKAKKHHIPRSLVLCQKEQTSGLSELSLDCAKPEVCATQEGFGVVRIDIAER